METSHHLRITTEKHRLEPLQMPLVDTDPRIQIAMQSLKVYSLSVPVLGGTRVVKSLHSRSGPRVTSRPKSKNSSRKSTEMASASPSKCNKLPLQLTKTKLCHTPLTGNILTFFNKQKMTQWDILNYIFYFSVFIQSSGRCRLKRRRLFQSLLPKSWSLTIPLTSNKSESGDNSLLPMINSWQLWDT